MEIFSAPSDQARLITTLIATFVALMIVYLTHYFNNKRSRNEIRLSKLEEIYRASIKYRKNAKNLLMIPSVMANRPTVSENNMEAWYKYADAKEELEIIILLHAPFLEKHLKPMDEIIRRATVSKKIGDAPEGVTDNYRGYNKYFYSNLSEFDGRLLTVIRQYA